MSDLDPPPEAVRDAVARALAEDLGPIGDVTAAVLPGETTIAGSFVVRTAGVFADGSCVTETYAQIDPEAWIDWEAADGDRAKVGSVVACIHGPARSVLTGSAPP